MEWTEVREHGTKDPSFLLSLDLTALQQGKSSACYTREGRPRETEGRCQYHCITIADRGLEG
jgi:hypothetical protein